MVPDTFCFTSACVLCGEEAVQDCLNAVRFDVRMQAFVKLSVTVCCRTVGGLSALSPGFACSYSPGVQSSYWCFSLVVGFYCEFGISSFLATQVLFVTYPFVPCLAFGSTPRILASRKNNVDRFTYILRMVNSLLHHG